MYEQQGKIYAAISLKKLHNITQGSDSGDNNSKSSLKRISCKWIYRFLSITERLLLRTAGDP